MVRKLLVVAFLVTFALASAQAARTADIQPGIGDIQANAIQDLSPGSKPVVWLRTNEVVYFAGEDAISLMVDIDQNGHQFDKSIFLYLQNTRTGGIRYINSVDGILDPGEITDYSGNDLDNVVAFPIPQLQDFTIFGDGGQLGGAIPTTQEMVGNHQFVLDFRDVTGRQVFSRHTFGFAVVEDVIELPGEIATDMVLTPNNAYFLNNATTFVRSGATLHIEAGVYVLGQGQFSALVVDRGGKIMALGTEMCPIVFTSAFSVGERAAADWGGLILNGRGPLNNGNGVGIGEGDTGGYGGGQNPDPEDDSGVLRYVRVEFAGTEFSPDNELNGIAFQAVGSKTVIEYIQVHYNLDDGVEFFGGTANARFVLLTFNIDDSLDWTDGWTGKVQFLVIHQRGDSENSADNGIEADNNEEVNDLDQPWVGRSNPTIYNMTIIGTGANGVDGALGFRLRRGSRVQMYNSIIINNLQAGMRFDGDSTVTETQQGRVAVTHSTFFGNNAGGANVDTTEAGFDAEAWVFADGKFNREVDPMLEDPTNFITPDYRPMVDSPALNVNFVRQPPNDGFFSPVTFQGAMDRLDDWTDGWTNYSIR